MYNIEEAAARALADSQKVVDSEIKHIIKTNGTPSEDYVDKLIAIQQKFIKDFIESHK